MYSRSVPTEIWSFPEENPKTISPTLPHGHYIAGIGLYPTDADFCLYETTTAPNATTPTATTTTIITSTTTTTTASTTATSTTNTLPTANAVLVLSTYNNANKPMVVDFNGKLVYKTEFVLHRL